MHLVANYDKAPFVVPPAYEQHSQGYTRIALVDHTIPGAVHTGLGLCRLEASGVLNPHVHFYEEAFFILEGQVLERIDGHDYRLGPGDYGIIQSGVSHALRNSGDQPVRWLEMLSPQPKSPDSERDTFFFKSESAPITGTPPDFRDPMTRYLGHFDDSQMPPYSLLQMEGYRGSSIAGISLKMLVDHMLGAQHLTLFMVEFQPGGGDDDSCLFWNIFEDVGEQVREDVMDIFTVDQHNGLFGYRNMKVVSLPFARVEQLQRLLHDQGEGYRLALLAVFLQGGTQGIQDVVHQSGQFFSAAHGLR